LDQYVTLASKHLFIRFIIVFKLLQFLHPHNLKTGQFLIEIEYKMLEGKVNQSQT